MLQNADEFSVSGARMADLDEIIANLRKRKEKLRTDLVEIDKAIAYFERAKHELSPDLFSKIESDTPEAQATTQRVRNAIPPKELALAARDVLLTKGRPMRRGEIVEELARRGIEMSGKDPNKNLGTILWRHDNIFVPIQGLGYWLKGYPIHGVYKPE